VGINPDQIWLDLCLGKEDAKSHCRVFLTSRVVQSKQYFVVLGPEEYEHRRTMNSASSVTQVWRELIAQADSTVLREKRRTDPDNRHIWRLKFIDHTNQRAKGTIFEISQWIFQTLAKELNLAVNLTFQKIEATAEDVLVLLNTLWARADDIPCNTSTRLSFHGQLLLAAIGGFRRATILELNYEDVALAVVRDPDNRLKTKLVVTPTIGKNKQKRATRVSRATK
jgi:6-pyruvoyl-tetrahydropterin synthase